MTDVERIAVKLDQLAAWRLPGGPKPTFPMPDEYEAVTEAASLLRSQAERIRVLEAALEPFAKAGRKLPDEKTISPESPVWGMRLDSWFRAVIKIPARDFTRARAAMEPRNG